MRKKTINFTATLQSLLCIFSLSPLLGWAHPHVWIEISVEPQLNAQGEITALKQHWIFDPLFSAISLHTLAKANQSEQAVKMQEIETQLLSSLQAQGFYLHSDKAVGDAQSIRLYAQDMQWHLQFISPLLEAQKTLRYRIYEPSYYIEILHQANHQQSFAQCLWRILPQKNPSTPLVEEKIDLSLASNMAESAKQNFLPQAVETADIGQYFAEEAEIICP